MFFSVKPTESNLNPTKRATINKTIYSLCARLPVITALTFIFASAARAQYSNVVLADHPVGYWPLNLSVDTNGTATDLSVNGNNGTYDNITSANNVAGPTYITNAVSFNGSDAWVDLSTGTNTSVLNVSGKISLEAWVQPASSQLQTHADIFAKGYYNGGSPYNEIEMSDVNSDLFVSGMQGGYYNAG